MSSSAGTVIASSIVVTTSPTTPVMAMEIGGDSFRPEDIGKGDFFDFVSSAPVTPRTSATTPVAAAEVDRQALTLCNNNNNNNSGSSGSSSNNGTANGNSSVMANASLNNGHDSTNGTTSTSAIDHQQQQPLQGYDQVRRYS